MIKIIKNKIALGALTSLFLFISQGVYSFDVQGESFPANFNMTS